MAKYKINREARAIIQITLDKLRGKTEFTKINVNT